MPGLRGGMAATRVAIARRAKRTVVKRRNIVFAFIPYNELIWFLVNKVELLCTVGW